MDNYDPLTDALDQFQNYGRLLIFSNLTAYDAESALVGDLATAWELDGTSWVFTLRDGVTWHDGSPFTADDVKYTFERILDPEVGSFAVPFIGEEATVEVVDPLTAKVNLPSVNASYPGSDDRGFDREEGFRGGEPGSADWHGSVQIRELVTE